MDLTHRRQRFVRATTAALSTCALLIVGCAQSDNVDTSGDANAAASAVLRDGDLPDWFVSETPRDDAPFTSDQPAFPELANCQPWTDVTSSGVSATVRGTSWLNAEPLRSFRSDVVVFESESLAENAMTVARSNPIGKCLTIVVKEFAEEQTTADLDPQITGILDTARIPSLSGNENAPWHFKTVYRPVTDTATTQSAVLDYVFERKGRAIVFFQISEVQLTDLDILPAADERLGAMTKVFNRLPEPQG